MIEWWSQLALVALGGGIGGALRHIVTVWFEEVAGERFPWGTLAVNLSGAFLLGVLLGFGAGQPAAHGASWLLLGIGVVGSYTTVSTLSLQALLMARDDRRGAALVYVATTLVAGVAAVFAGYLLGTVA
jgi:CrcB protein